MDGAKFTAMIISVKVELNSQTQLICSLAWCFNPCLKSIKSCDMAPQKCWDSIALSYTPLRKTQWKAHDHQSHARTKTSKHSFTWFSNSAYVNKRRSSLKKWEVWKIFLFRRRMHVGWTMLNHVSLFVLVFSCMWLSVASFLLCTPSNGIWCERFDSNKNMWPHSNLNHPWMMCSSQIYGPNLVGPYSLGALILWTLLYG